MDSVYLLWYVTDAEDELFIGAYRSETDAAAAIERLRDKPGFAIAPDRFQICPYELNKDHWTDGFRSPVD